MSAKVRIATSAEYDLESIADYTVSIVHQTPPTLCVKFSRSVIA